MSTPSSAAAAAAAQARPRDDEGDDAAARATRDDATLPGTKLKLPQGTVASTRTKDSDMPVALPPRAGTRLSYVHKPGTRLDPRLGMTEADFAAVARRVGGGWDTPSIEAVTFDRGDILDAQTRAMNNPSSPYPGPR